MTLILSILAVAFSLIGVFCLMLRDPKRRRSFGMVADPRQDALRPFLVAFTILPSIVLLALGDAAAFFVWFAAITVLGWLLVIAPLSRT
ncbi:hypothetical protein [Erythrobacter rubeus]|uniref:DUF3325 domain-containing protein n=1 Tax=Erythrobacter rubeus TaxID=2760803 RepID=A0ABR8KKY4_9SPHN|nr:hypothetical protein [Erythrobacter rubeus]MBD2840981.1 hypothetical protein [Erythrobacter rubeus]